MSGLVKGLTAILGIIAVLACIATVGIIGYSLVGGSDNNKKNNNDDNNAIELALEAQATPSEEPTADPNVTATPQPVFEGHVHDYQPVVIKKANCTEAGQVEYICSCGDSYVIDQLSTGHVPDDEWEIVKAATNTEDGRRVRKCLYCGEVVASEIIPATGTNSSGTSADGSISSAKHEHLYVATTEREPTCVLAGLRKHTCSCGNFYTDTIPAVGHVATDWTVKEEATTTKYGTSERTCSVCGTLLDTKVLPLVSPSPSASSSASASGSSSASSSGSPAASSGASASASASPSPTPHVHNYVSYIVTPATCTQKGVRSYVCSGCGSSYAESIELDLNNHSFAATFVAPTDTQQGYTVYTCTRCNYNYKDNYIMPLTNTGSSESEDENTGSN